MIIASTKFVAAAAFLLALLAVTAKTASAFAVPQPSTASTASSCASSTRLSMGFLDAVFGPKSAEASHILLKGPNASAQCEKLKTDIYKRALKKGAVDGGIEPAALMEAFAQSAKSRSTCPSKANGGSLGVFGRGEMVPEFDAVAFNEQIGVVHGPVETQFGSHLILVTERK